MLELKKLFAGVLLALPLLLDTACAQQKFDDGFIKYAPYKASEEYCGLVENIRKGLLKNYDADESMRTISVSGWNYHTDKIGVKYHHVMSTLNFIQVSLDTMNDSYLPEIEKSILAVLQLQQRDKSKPHYGVWPYYKEEPVLTKKSPVDYNWADFPAVALLDIYTEHGHRLSAPVREKIKEALISAAESIQKRNVTLSYTNIAIMGTYVTYLVSHLFDIPEMKAYAKDRLKRFHKYTFDNGGFNEFNSPTYTIVAIAELSRLHKHISDPDDLKMVEQLEEIEWDMLARHYHVPTMQWAGPHSRCYNSLIYGTRKQIKSREEKSVALGSRPLFQDYIQKASGGKIDFGRMIPHSVDKLDLRMPKHLSKYFINPEYPRLEIDKFTKNDNVVGTCWLTADYAFSTANFSTMWNQARPILMYFKNEKGAPAYFQPRFLHDGFDFSSVFFTSSQNKDAALCAMSYITNKGDKHIHIDRTNGKIKAKDLRLRFEVGNSSRKITLPKEDSETAYIDLPNQRIAIALKSFGDMRGKWEISETKGKKQLDYVIYNGAEKQFNLIEMKEAALVFSFEINPKQSEAISVTQRGDEIEASWKNLNVRAKKMPMKINEHSAMFKNSSK